MNPSFMPISLDFAACFESCSNRAGRWRLVSLVTAWESPIPGGGDTGAHCGLETGPIKHQIITILVHTSYVQAYCFGYLLEQYQLQTCYVAP